MCSTIKRFLPLFFVVSLAVSSFGQSGNQGSLKTTNSPFAGALLTTDGSKYYWSYPTNLQVNATNAQPPSSVLTNLSGTRALTNASSKDFGVQLDTLYSKNLSLNSRWVYFDDFNQDMTTPGLLPDAPTGHKYTLLTQYGNTNHIIQTNGYWSMGNTGAVYRSVHFRTNAQYGPMLYPNSFGGNFRYRKSTNGTVDGVERGLTFILSTNADFVGKPPFLHVSVGASGFHVGRELSATNLLYVHPLPGNRNLQHLTNYNFSITIISNVLIAEIAGYKFMTYDESLSTTYAGVNVATWESTGTHTNEAWGEWDSAWAGYSTPTESQLWGGPFKFGSNFVLTSTTFSDNSVQSTAASNSIVVAAGTGGITVSAVSSGGITTFTVDDDDAGSGGGGGGAGSLPANANQFSTNTTLTFISGALATNLNARGITIPQLTTDRALYVNGSGNVTNSPNVTSTELEYLDGLTAPISTSLSNQVRVAAGSGGITVTPSGSGGVMTFTISDDDAGGGGGGGGTNNPILIEGPQVTLIANQTARSQHTTNQSFNFSIIGASNYSSRAQFFAQNTSSSIIYLSNLVTTFSVKDGSNVTAFAIPPTSTLELNLSLSASNQWVAIVNTKEYQLVPDGTTVTGTYDHAAGTYTLTATAASASTNLASINVSNVIRRTIADLVVTNTDPTFLDLARYSAFRIRLTTNATLIATNNFDGMVDAFVSVLQGSNGTRTIDWSLAGGRLQTNSALNYSGNTNANSVTKFRLSFGDFSTNLQLSMLETNLTPQIGHTNSLASGTTVKPLELVTDPAKWATSFDRKLSNGWTGAIYLAVRSSDGATNYLVESGGANNLAALETWSGGANVYATNLFNQSGNGLHLVQGDTNLCPVVITNGVAVTKNGRGAAMRLSANVVMSATTTINLPVSMIFNAYSESITSSDIFVNGNSTTRTAVKQLASSYRITSGANVDAGTLTADQWDIIQAIFLPTGTGPDSFAIDGGSFNPGEAGDNGMTAIVLGSSSVCADMIFGDWMGWDAEVDTGELGAVRDEMNAYWSIY